MHNITIILQMFKIFTLNRDPNPIGDFLKKLGRWVNNFTHFSRKKFLALKILKTTLIQD